MLRLPEVFAACNIILTVSVLPFYHNQEKVTGNLKWKIVVTNRAFTSV
jgi:hypothetical protein